MSVEYRCVRICDRCDAEHEEDSAQRPSSGPRGLNPRKKKDIEFEGWRFDVEEEDCIYGEVCPDCVQEIKNETKKN